MNGFKEVFERLLNLSSGERSALRHKAGRALDEADGMALQALFRVMPGSVAPADYGKWFTILTIACLWNVNEVTRFVDMPEMLRECASECMDRRIRALLDTRWDDAGYFAGKLARIAHMLRAKDQWTMPDGWLLLDDLKKWDYDSRSAQLRWARKYYLDVEE